MAAVSKAEAGHITSSWTTSRRIALQLLSMPDGTPSIPAPTRVITAHDEGGKSIIQQIDLLRYQLYPNSKSSFSNVWTFDRVPTNDNNISSDPPSSVPTWQTLTWRYSQGRWRGACYRWAWIGHRACRRREMLLQRHCAGHEQAESNGALPVLSSSRLDHTIRGETNLNLDTAQDDVNGCDCAR